MTRLSEPKPGGTYLVIDHNAESGSGWRDASTLHGNDPVALKSEVTAAGFELETDGNLLAKQCWRRRTLVAAYRG